MSTGTERHAFAVALREQMKRRGVSNRTLAATIGTSSEAVNMMVRGTVLPTVTTAGKLADALLDQSLLSMVVAARTRPCAVCRKTVTDHGNRHRLYCGATCYRLGRKGVTVTLPVIDERDAAIQAMCRSCEPAGQCRTFECALRPVSPLPYVPATDAPIAVQPDPWTPERRAATGLRSKDAWERRRAQWREGQRATQRRREDAA